MIEINLWTWQIVTSVSVFAIFDLIKEQIHNSSFIDLYRELQAQVLIFLTFLFGHPLCNTLR